VAEKRVAKQERADTAICLICWDKDRAEFLEKLLGGEGFRVTVVSESVSGRIAYFRDLNVEAVVIDLSRMPSHGREIGAALSASKSTRHLPLIFLGGQPEKVERVRRELPEAVFAGWEDAAATIRSAMIAGPTQKAMRPAQRMEIGGRSLARKLGVKQAVPVVLWGDAEFLVELLGDFPVVKRMQGKVAHLCLCVTRAASDVEAAFETVGAVYPEGTLMWIIHPKQSGKMHADFNQNDVRGIGLAHGWVDFKVCAVDADWSGLAFAKREVGEALPRRSSNPRMVKGSAKAKRD
jgi:CheY-like chemotaxis protein